MHIQVNGAADKLHREQPRAGARSLAHVSPERMGSAGQVCDLTATTSAQSENRSDRLKDEFY